MSFRGVVGAEYKVSGLTLFSEGHGFLTDTEYKSNKCYNSTNLANCESIRNVYSGLTPED